MGCRNLETLSSRHQEILGNSPVLPFLSDSHVQDMVQMFKFLPSHLLQSAVPSLNVLEFSSELNKQILQWWFLCSDGCFVAASCYNLSEWTGDEIEHTTTAAKDPLISHCCFLCTQFEMKWLLSDFVQPFGARVIDKWNQDLIQR